MKKSLFCLISLFCLSSCMSIGTVKNHSAQIAELKYSFPYTGATFLDQPKNDLGLANRKYKVFQAFEDGIGLAYPADQYTPVVLVYQPDLLLYDGIIINSKPGKTFKIIGTYKYQSNDEHWHTVPIISAM